MEHGMARACEAILIGLLAGSCAAQSAVLTVSHDDPHGLVSPGQTVRVMAVLTRTVAVELYEIKGSVRATPDAGTSATPVFPYQVQAWPERVVNPGTPGLGSVLDIHIRQGASSMVPFAGLSAPPWNLGWFPAGLTITQFDWTAPTTPGIVTFDWRADPAVPDATLIYTSQPHFRATSTTYVGTSLIVIPAPGGVALLAALGWLGVRRGRAASAFPVP